MKTYVIIGAGVAGASAAEALRGEGFDGRVVLVGEETDLPYQRPPLSKELLRGEVTDDSVLLRTPGFYQSSAIELRLGERVVEIDPRLRRIAFASGARLDYDKVLVATGGEPRRMLIPSASLPGVCYLRRRSQAIALRDALQQHPHVLIVGAGFIGCEVAASARQLGCEVTVAAPTPPMAHALGQSVAGAYAAYHSGHGVKLKPGATVTEFRGAARLEEALLSDGSAIPCSLAVVGIGIAPTQGVLSGVETRDGIVTDEHCRTEIENVFAAGDIACSWRPRLNRRVRLEHFDNAESQGAAAARSMCDKLDPYDPIPFFWSDQYEFALQYYGNAASWDDVVLRGNPDDGSFIAFYMQSGRLEAGCLVNRSRDASALKRLLGKSGISRTRLADDDVPLKALISTGVRLG
ncbi:MAG: NAD(P)/FAD-dependent oxidoreductase [Vulcanimicrobiaceae bacterium]